MIHVRNPYKPDELINVSAVRQELTAALAEVRKPDVRMLQDARDILEALEDGRAFDVYDTDAEELPEEIDPVCPVCGDVHKPCIFCGRPTRCDPQEPGEQFINCDECDAEMDYNN